MDREESRSPAPSAHSVASKATSISSLLRNFTQGRPRAQTTQSSDRFKSNATASDRLSGLLASHQNRRVVSGAAQTSATDVTGGDVGQYDSTPPSAFLDAWVTAKSAVVRADLARRLAVSVHVHESADAISIWLACADLLAEALLDARLAALTLFGACATTVNARSPLAVSRAPDRAVLYASIYRFLNTRVNDLENAELYASVAALEALCRGGRDITGLENFVPLLWDLSAESFLRQQADRAALRTAAFPPLGLTTSYLSPLLDPGFATPFVSTAKQPAEVLMDPATSPLALLTAVHKFSWPQLTPALISASAAYALNMGLATSSNIGIELVLHYIMVIARYGYVPAQQMESVIEFVARCVGIEGHVQLLQGSGQGATLVALPPTISRLARTAMRDLLCSPANQALQHLRAATGPPDAEAPEAPLRCDVSLKAGALRCFRQALQEYYESGQAADHALVAPLPTTTTAEGFPVLLAVGGLAYLYGNLCDAVAWRSPEVDEEVLSLLDDLLVARGPEPRAPAPPANSSTPPLSPTGSKPISPTQPAPPAQTRLSYEEWQMIVGLLDRTEWHFGALETRSSLACILDVTYDSTSLPPSRRRPKSMQTASGETSTHQNVLELYKAVFSRVVIAYTDGSYLVPVNAFLALAAKLSPRLSDAGAVFLIEQYEREHLCLPSSADWLARLNEVVDVLLPGLAGTAAAANESAWLSRVARPRARIKALAFLCDVYSSVRATTEYREQIVRSTLMPVLHHLLTPQRATDWEPELAPALHGLITEFVRDALELARDVSTLPEGHSAPNDRSGTIFDLLRNWLVRLARAPPAEANGVSSRSTSRTRRAQSGIRTDEPASVGPSVPLVVASECQEPGLFAISSLIGIFAVALHDGNTFAAVHAILVFRDLLSILSTRPNPTNEASEPVAPRRCRFAALQFFVRLRASQDHRIAILRDVDISALASGIDRVSSGSANDFLRDDEPVNQDPRGRSKSKIHQTASPDGRGRSSRNASTNRSDRSPSRPHVIEVEPLWRVPEEILFHLPSPVIRGIRANLLSFDPHLGWTESEALPGDDERWKKDEHAAEARSDNAPLILPISEYLETLVYLLEHEPDWDFVSYILCHLSPQLSDKYLAAGPRAAREIRSIRAILCRGLRTDQLAERTTTPSGVKRSELFSIAYQVLSTLICYRTLFSKDQQMDLIATFAHGLSRRDVAKPCIHALAMSCHELGQSVATILPATLRALMRIMSTEVMAVHILEFIASVGQLPSLYGNFTDDDFRAVFGIALQYITLHHQSRVDQSDTPAAAASKRNDYNIAFSQYVFHLAYYVIDLWYMSLRLAARPQYVQFITRKLVQACAPRGGLDEPSEVCLDMVARYAYANVDPRPRTSALHDMVSHKSDGRNRSTRSNPGSQRTWISGYALITIRRLDTSRWAEITVRRASGTVQVVVELENAVRPTNASDDDIMRMLMQHRHESGLAAPNNWPSTSLELATPAAAVAFPHLHQKRSRSSSFSGTHGNADASSRLCVHGSAALLPEEEQHNALRALHAAAVVNAVPLDVARLKFEERIQRETSKTNEADEPDTVGPSFFAIQLSALPQFGSAGPPVLLPDVEKYQRTVSLLDKVAVVDMHKIGVIYVGPGQSNEVDILANSYGSHAYVELLNSLGRIIPLKGCKDYYLGGLDTDTDFDGRWTYVWENNVTQLVFHIATLMPTTMATDPQCTLKKRHIGNDFVKIVYNDSCREFAFDTLPGQFNFVNVVVEPQAPACRSSSPSGRCSASSTPFFKVYMQRRLDMPEIGPLGVFKMVSAASLGQVVRHLSLHANIFAQVFLATIGIEGGRAGQQRQKLEFVSNWRSRLQQIKRIKTWLATELEGEGADDGEDRELDEGRDVSTWTA